MPYFPSEVCGVEELSSRQQTGQGLERASFSSASPQPPWVTLDTQVAHVGFSSCVVDLGACLGTPGEWWMQAGGGEVGGRWC